MVAKTRLKRFKPHSEYDLTGELTLNDSSDVACALNRTVIQDALDQLGTEALGGPGDIVQLPRGPIWIDRPILHQSNCVLAGTRGKLSTQLIPKYYGGPIIIAAKPEPKCPEGPGLLTGEDFSLDFALASEGSAPDYVSRMIDYSQLGVTPRNWTAFNFEFTYRLTSTPIDIQIPTLFMIGGRRTTGEGAKTALQLSFVSGQLVASVRISTPGATNFEDTALTTLAVPTASTVGTTYHVCLDWDGTTVRLWHGATGAALAAPVATAAKTGVFHTKLYEMPQLGCGAYFQFPDPMPVIFGWFPGYVGGHRFGAASKRTAAYTAPSAAYAPAANDWICFVPIVANRLGLTANDPTSGNIYRVNMFGGNVGYTRLVRNTYVPIEYCTVKDLTIGGGVGRGTIGILASGSINSHFERINFAYVGMGLIMQNNCYLSTVRGCDFTGGPFAWAGMPAGGSMIPRIGMAIGGATGNCVISKLKIQGFGYGFCAGYGSFEGESIWIIEGHEVKAFFTSPTTCNVRSLLIADEGEEPDDPVDYGLLLELSGIGQAITFSGTTIEVSKPLGNTVPIGISGQDHRTRVTFSGAKVLLKTGHPQTEVIRFLNTTCAPVVFRDLQTEPVEAVVTLSPGKVVRDGLSAPVLLANADSVVKWHEGRLRVLPTLTANRTYDLDDVNDGTFSQPHDGAAITVARPGTDAFTAAFRNGVGGPTIYTFPVSQQGNVGFMRVANACRMTGTPTLTFATGPDTITRSTGSWITDGFVVGDLVTIKDSVYNTYTLRITVLSATVMTFGTATLAAESLSTATVYASRWVAVP